MRESSLSSEQVRRAGSPWARLCWIAVLAGGCNDDGAVAPIGTGIATAGAPSDETSSGAPQPLPTTTTGSESSTTNAPPGEDDGPSDDDASVSTGAGSTGASDESSGGVGIACPAGELSSLEFPNSVVGDTFDQSDEFSGCGPDGAPDMAWTFTAPADGNYSFDTVGSTFDTVLYVLDGPCAGDELACNDNGLGAQSVVTVDLVQDQTVTVVVDSFSVFGGSVRLTARSGSVACPVADLGDTVPQTVVDGTVVATDEFTGSCAGGSAPDVGYLFTAPGDGLYLFELNETTFSTNLYLLDGMCGGTEIACNHDAPAGANGSALIASLSADQQVTVVVDGHYDSFGDFELSIDRLPGSCPDEDLGSAFPATVDGSTTGLDNGVGSTCGGLKSPDYSYTWTAPEDGTYLIDTIGSDFDTVISVNDGDCSGTQLSCSDDVPGGDGESRLAISLVADQTVVITVDGQGAAGSYTLNIGEAVTSGDCCVPHGTPGCEVEEIETCVCGNDIYCCNSTWDGVCANQATGCGAICL